MSVALSAITGATTEGSVDIAGETVTFSYKPPPITVGMAMQLSKGGIEMATVLADVIDSWDLVSGGRPHPISVEGVDALPIELATKIAQVVTGGDAEEEVGEADGGSFAG